VRLAGRGTLLHQLLSPLLPLAAWRTLRAQVDGPRTGDRSGASEGEEPSGEMRSWTGGWRALLAVVAAQLFLAGITSWGGSEPLLAPFYQATAVTFGLFFSRLRGFCEHVPPHDWHGTSYIRSHRAHWLERFFLYDLGMNWHLEHHLYPTVPGYRLKEVNRYLSSLHTAESCRDSMMGTILRRLRTAPSW
jgi:fatty acid desaturase